MFELSIEKSEQERAFASSRISLLRKVLESIADFIDDVELKVSESGILIQVMDSGFSAFADIFLSKAIFCTYRCDRNLVLGIKVKAFVTALKKLNIDRFDTFTMSSDDDAKILTLELENSEMRLTYDVNLYTFVVENFGEPATGFCADIQIGVEKFVDIQRAIGDSGKYMSIDIRKNDVYFGASGNMVTSSLMLKAGAQKGTSQVNVAEPIKRELLLKYVNAVGKVAPLAETVKIYMGESTPILFEFTLGELGYMKYYIAPREEENEESESE